MHLRSSIKGQDNIAIQSMHTREKSKRGKSVFVFGNGPSLKILSAAKIDSLLTSGDFDLLCVNHFPFSKFFDLLSRGSGISLLLSDPHSFSNSNSARLKVILGNLNHNKLAELYAPSWIKRYLRKGQPKYASVFQEIVATNKVLYFNDMQGSGVFSRSITPLKPRSYISMSVFKALAIAGYLGYEKIYICGVDNTYAKLLGNDFLNRIFRTDVHFDNTAYTQSSSRDYFWAQSGVDMSGALMESASLFLDLKKKFGLLPVINLDPHSLTDGFIKSTALDVYSEACHYSEKSSYL